MRIVHLVVSLNRLRLRVVRHGYQSSGVELAQLWFIWVVVGVCGENTTSLRNLWEKISWGRQLVNENKRVEVEAPGGGCLTVWLIDACTQRWQVLELSFVPGWRPKSR